jgi:hypothetical protein
MKNLRNVALVALLFAAGSSNVMASDSSRRVTLVQVEGAYANVQTTIAALVGKIEAMNDSLANAALVPLKEEMAKLALSYGESLKVSEKNYIEAISLIDQFIGIKGELSSIFDDINKRSAKLDQTRAQGARETIRTLKSAIESSIQAVANELDSPARKMKPSTNGLVKALSSFTARYGSLGEDAIALEALNKEFEEFWETKGVSTRSVSPAGSDSSTDVSRAGAV